MPGILLQLFRPVAFAALLSEALVAETVDSISHEARLADVVCRRVENGALAIVACVDGDRMRQVLVAEVAHDA